jgi:thymidylate synthase
MNRFKTTSEAYLALINDVMFNCQYESSPRGQKIKEILHYSVEITNPTSETLKTLNKERNAKIAAYTDKELKWYLSGSLNVDDAKEISSVWEKLVNPDKTTINSNYGHLLLKDESEGHPIFSENKITPYEWAKNSLLKDKDSRQAIMRVNKPKHCFYRNEDFVCTMYLNFHIRNNKLHCLAKMRSSDLMFGIVYDWPFFIYIQETLLEDLKSKYPEINIGSFVFQTDSLHIYQRNFKTMLDMIGFKNKIPKRTGNVSMTIKDSLDLQSGDIPGFYVEEGAGKNKKLFAVPSSKYKLSHQQTRRSFAVLNYRSSVFQL